MIKKLFSGTLGVVKTGSSIIFGIAGLLVGAVIGIVVSILTPVKFMIGLLAGAAIGLLIGVYLARLGTKAVGKVASVGVTAGKAVVDAGAEGIQSVSNAVHNARVEIQQPQPQVQPLRQPIMQSSYEFNEELFRQNAEMYGINPNGKSNEEIANHFLKYAPAVALDNISENMSDVERADRIMRGAY